MPKSHPSVIRGRITKICTHTWMNQTYTKEHIRNSYYWTSNEQYTAMTVSLFGTVLLQPVGEL